MTIPALCYWRHVVDLQFAAFAAIGASSLLTLAKGANIFWGAISAILFLTCSAASISGLSAQLVCFWIGFDPLTYALADFWPVLFAPFLLIGLVLLHIRKTPTFSAITRGFLQALVSMVTLLVFFRITGRTRPVYGSARSRMAMLAWDTRKIRWEFSLLSIRSRHDFHAQCVSQSQGDEVNGS